MYTKDKTTRVTLRLNQEQFDFVKASGDAMGLTPSEFLRCVINTTLTAQSSTAFKQAVAKGLESEARTLEHEIANKHDIV